MYKYKTKPFEHQRQSLIEGAFPFNFAYFMEMGTGKTKVAIDNAAYLFQKEEVEQSRFFPLLPIQPSILDS